MGGYREDDYLKMLIKVCKKISSDQLPSSVKNWWDSYERKLEEQEKRAKEKEAVLKKLTKEELQLLGVYI